MAPSFSYATWLQTNQEVSLRLNDISNIRWTKAEVYLYLSEALRLWNCLTQQWEVDFTATYVQPSPATLPIWQSLGNSQNSLVGSNPSSPRYQTLTDSDVYTIAQYHLLEPPNGNATWAGTTQFALTDFVNGFTRRRDQILQITDCNVGPFEPTLSILPGTNRVQLPDSTSQSILDLRRIRFVPAANQGPPSTLYRDDTLSFEYFTNDYEQTRSNPLCWDILGSPQQFVTFDARSNVPATLDCLGILSGGTITPPTAAPLLIPDDYSWVLKFGMMADMLTKETESRDLLRAQYCVPLDSEILTRVGWKKYNEVYLGDEVLGYNSQTDRCEWTTLTAVNLVAQQEVHTYGNRMVEFRCTADHRWVFKERNGAWNKKDKISVRPIDGTAQDSVFVQAAPAPDGEGLEAIGIQEFLHKNLGIEKVLQMTSGERRAFILGLLYGEGNSHKGNGDKRSTLFAQNPGPVYDAVKLACALEGIPTTKGKMVRKGCKTLRFALLQKPIWKRGINKKTHVAVEDVWCPTTKLGTWVMRQNDQITITGNCEQRFSEGVRMMIELPWLMQAWIDNVPVDTPSFYEADQFDYEWQSNPNAMSAIIRGGIDLFAIAPIIPAGTTLAVTLSLIGNAPIPTTDGGFVQVSRDVLDAIIDEAVHLAQFKEGGQEMMDSIQLHQKFIQAAMQTNSRLALSGIFATDLRRPISKENESEPRFALAAQGEPSK